MPLKRIEVRDRITGPDYHPPRTERWYARQQGNLLEVRRVVNHSHVPTEAKRGKIVGFTNASRLRMLRLIATIDWQAIPECQFITLTYPDANVNRTYKQRTQDRWLLTKSLEEFKGHLIPTLWRVEWQPRQSGEFRGQLKPHLHIVACFASQILRKDLRQMWKKATGIPTWCSVDSRPAKSPEHGAKYAAKYAAKAPTLDHLDNNAYLETHGRAWGTTRRQLIPRCPESWIRDMNSESRDAAMKVAARILEKEYVGTFFVLGTAAPVLLTEIADKGRQTIDT